MWTFEHFIVGDFMVIDCRQSKEMGAAAGVGKGCAAGTGEKKYGEEMSVAPPVVGTELPYRPTHWWRAVGDTPVTPGPLPRFDEGMKLKEDYDLTCQHIGELRALARTAQAARARPRAGAIRSQLTPLHSPTHDRSTHPLIQLVALAHSRTRPLISPITQPRPPATYGGAARSNRVFVKAQHYTNEGGAVAVRNHALEQVRCIVAAIDLPPRHPATPPSR